VLIEGCAIQIAGLAVLALTVAFVPAPSALVLASILMIFGYGQGLVMAPLSGVVLSSVKPASAGSGSGMYGTPVQIANAAGVAAIGAVLFAVESTHAAQSALFVSIALFVFSIMTSAALLSWMRRVSA
jgi:predicted MFS family arabinose efflux permease